MPLISVLMGAYNNAETIVDSIKSIQAQTITDWEFIICDDASRDNTYDIVKKISEQDNRIILIKNDKNMGLSYALNHCLKYAKGEFCARMDGDDLCNPTRFEKQIKFLRDNSQFGFVSTTMLRFDENGIYQTPKKKEPYEPTVRDFAKGSPFCHAPVMMRTKYYKEVNGYRDIEKTCGVEDYDLWFRLYAAGIKGCTLNEPLYSMFDGRNAAKRRTFKRRLNEAWVRWQGYKAIKVPFIWRIYVLKPIVIGFIPQWLYKIIRR